MSCLWATLSLSGYSCCLRGHFCYRHTRESGLKHPSTEEEAEAERDCFACPESQNQF